MRTCGTPNTPVNSELVYEMFGWSSEKLLQPTLFTRNLRLNFAVMAGSVFADQWLN